MKSKKLKPEIIKKIVKDNITGIDAVEIIPLINLGSALKGTISCLKQGLIPASYSYSKEKTESAYSYKNYKSWAKSIIVAAKYYYTDEKFPEEKAFGRIARFTWRNNYRYLSLKLEDAVNKISDNIGIPIISKILSNYTSIPEKALCKYSGIADFGKNSVLINRSMGSYFTVGEAFIDLDIDFDEIKELEAPDYTLCGSCNLCRAACPTHAIIKNGVININRCFQYISENLILMPLKYREKWGNRLYGCSICIDVCPYNKNLVPWAKKHNIGFVGQGMDLLEVLSLKQEEWDRTFIDNQIVIRDPGAILKNAITSLGYLEYKKSIDFLFPFLNHEHEIIRAYTAWAIGKINTKTGKKMLYARYKEEKSQMVKTEIECIL